MHAQPQTQTSGTVSFNRPLNTHDTSCISIVWLKDRFPRQLQNAFLVEVQKNDGVRSARFSPKEPSLLIVSYDVMRTKPLDILTTIRSLGADARLVGC